jgi:DNA end-binding protein Ku
VWTGAISFGLVNVPVKAYTAARDHEIHFHQLEKGTGARIRYQKVSDKTGREVDADDIELGYELSSGRYVTVDPDELDELRPRTTRTIDVTDFVALDDIDPIYYEKTYWLAPADETAERPYRLLLAALADRRRVGIGTVVMRRKQYLGAIRPLDGALAVSTMRFADEVVGQDQIDELPARRTKPDAKELKLATTIVDALAADWDPERYHDTYTDELKSLIERKAAGETITVEEEPEGTAEVIDLMAALEASVKAAKQARGAGGTKRAADLQRRIERVADDLRPDDGDGDGDGQDSGRAKRAASAPAKQASRKRTSAKRTSPKADSQKSTSAKKASTKKSSSKTTKKAASKKASARSGPRRSATAKRASAGRGARKSA